MLFGRWATAFDPGHADRGQIDVERAFGEIQIRVEVMLGVLPARQHAEGVIDLIHDPGDRPLRPVENARFALPRLLAHRCPASSLLIARSIWSVCSQWLVSKWVNHLVNGAPDR